jgi:trehalose utilization protein
MDKKIRVTIWNEYFHERHDEEVKRLYPEGMHTVIADYLVKQGDISTRIATIDMPEHGLTEEVLDNTDVLTWWGHKQHNDVSDEIVNRVYHRVLEGMGMGFLHSAHESKLFKKLSGTESGRKKWRETGDKERVWTVEPGHPIVDGLENEYFELEQEEMYGERFDIPAPDTLVFISWFAGGEVLRSGCCYNRGKGKYFYFQPGHETFPTYYHPQVMRVIYNAVKWARPINSPYVNYDNVPPMEKI